MCLKENLSGQEKRHRLKLTSLNPKALLVRTLYFVLLQFRLFCQN